MFVGRFGPQFVRWATANSMVKPGQALAFDFAADLSWIARLPKDMAGEFAVGLTLEGGASSKPPLVVVRFSGSGKS